MTMIAIFHSQSLQRREQAPLLPNIALYISTSLAARNRCPEDVCIFSIIVAEPKIPRHRAADICG
jgi:hypothetical protein